MSAWLVLTADRGPGIWGSGWPFDRGLSMNARELCHRIYRKAKRYIAPSVRSSKSIYAETLGRYVRPGTEWLDVGCGHRLLPRQMEDEEARLLSSCRTVMGVDSFLPSLRSHHRLALKAQADIRQLPIRENSFSLLTANMVVEHLDQPAQQFTELRRVLKPGGVFLFRTPNVWGYMTILARMVPEFLKARVIYFLQQRKEEDVFPTHYRANSLRAIERIARQSGFEIVECRSIVSDCGFVMIPPLAILELLWLRVLMTRPFRPFRTNFIFALRKLTREECPERPKLDLRRRSTDPGREVAAAAFAPLAPESGR